MRYDRLIYGLKRSQGRHVFIYRDKGSAPNLQTGVLVRDFTIFEINKAVILPAHMVTKQENGKGNYDLNSRAILLDLSDTPNYEPRSDDEIEFNNERYQIKDFQEVESRLVQCMCVRLERDNRELNPFLLTLRSTLTGSVQVNTDTAVGVY